MKPSPELAALLRDYALLAKQSYRTLTLDQLDSLDFYNAELDYRVGRLDNSRGALVARWIRDVNALETYVTTTGTFPRDNRRLDRDRFTPEHRRLITWVNTSIREIGLGNRCDYQVRRLQTIPGFELTPRPALWQWYLTEYRHFIRAHPGVPSTRGTSFDERRLAWWRARQRSAYRRGALNAEQIEALEATPSWRW
jgi:Helicase associated domain